MNSLDPDGPMRDFERTPGLPLRLSDTDESDEAEMLKSCLLHVRAGQLDKSAELCTECGQPWRAATILGNGTVEISYAEGDERVTPRTFQKNANLIYVGNPNFALWRRACWALGRKCERITRQKTITKVSEMTYSPEIYESALYATLANDHELLLSSPILCSWMDHLWIYFRGLLQRSIDETVTLHNTKRREAASRFPFVGASKCNAEAEYEQLQATSSLGSLDTDSIFAALEKSQYQNISAVSTDPYNLAITAIIKGDEDSVFLFVKQVWSLLGTHDMTIELLRFSVHLVIYFSSYDDVQAHPSCRLTPEVETNDLVIAYIEHLVSVREIELVALYCSLLPDELCVQEYTSFLLVVEDPQERETTLGLANTFFPHLALTIIRNVSSSVIVNDECEEGRKLHALKWFALGDDHWQFYGTIHANRLLRLLLSNNKLECCKVLVSGGKSEDGVDGVGNGDGDGDGDGDFNYDYQWASKLPEDLSDTVDSVLNEHRCYCAFLRSHGAFEQFRSILSECSHESMIDDQNIANENFSFSNENNFSKLKSSEIDLFQTLKNKKNKERKQDLTNTVLQYADVAERELMAVLDFEGGFLNIADDNVEEFEENAERNFEVDKVRSFLIPLVFTMAYSVFDLVGKMLLKHKEYRMAEEWFDKALNLSVLLCRQDGMVDVMGPDNCKELLAQLGESFVEKMRCRKKNEENN